MKQLILIAPEVLLSVLALFVCTAETFLPNRRKLWYGIAFVGLWAVLIHQALFFVQHSFLGAAGFGVTPTDVRGFWIQYPLAFGMVSVDSLAVFFKIAIVSAVIMVLWLSIDYREFRADSDKAVPIGTFVTLILLSTVGMLLLVSSVDFILAVISLELLSISSFILTGFVLSRKSSTEGAIKYLLVGTFSAGVLLFGISYYYGYFGTTRLDALLRFPATGSPDLVLSLIVIFIISGFGFKLAMVPFHMWAPDAYEGAPSPITAFLSSAPKAAAVGFLLRLLGNHQGLNLTPMLSILAAITMTVGNIGALHQTNLKRLLAYSSIAQIGYILVALVAGGNLGGQAAMVYTFVYLFMNLGVFAVLMVVSNALQSDDISAFAGLYRKSMGLSLALTVFLLSLTGIPPMAGFVGKFTIFASVIQRPDLIWLGVVAALNSVVSLYYYFKIVYQMFFREPDGSAAALNTSPALLSCLALALIVTLAAGLYPDSILGWVRNVVGS